MMKIIEDLEDEFSLIALDIETFDKRAEHLNTLFSITVGFSIGQLIGMAYHGRTGVLFWTVAGIVGLLILLYNLIVRMELLPSKAPTDNIWETLDFMVAVRNSMRSSMWRRFLVVIPSTTVLIFLLLAP